MPGQRLAQERSLEQVRASLCEKAFTDLWEEGRMLSLDDVWSARHRPLPL